MMNNTEKLIELINEKCETIYATGYTDLMTDVCICGADSDDVLFSFDDDSGFQDAEWNPDYVGDEFINPWELAWVMNACAFLCSQNSPYVETMPVISKKIKKELSATK